MGYKPQYSDSLSSRVQNLGTLLVEQVLWPRRDIFVYGSLAFKSVYVEILSNASPKR